MPAIVLCVASGKLRCVCTTPECDHDGTASCVADHFCYVQLFPPLSPVASQLPRSPSSRSRSPSLPSLPLDITRGCIDDDTPLLCENKRPSTYNGAWPILHCCSQDWCNRLIVPTFPPWAKHVEGDRTFQHSVSSPFLSRTQWRRNQFESGRGTRPVRSA